MEALPDEFIDALISEPVYRATVDLICECGSKLEMGYCLNPECKHDAPVEVFDCEWCGCCPDPARCVWSVTCPLCSALPSEMCHAGSRLTGLHKERWESLGSPDLQR